MWVAVIFNAGGNPTMHKRPIHGREEILLLASCDKKRDRLRPDGPLGSYADYSCILYKI